VGAEIHDRRLSLGHWGDALGGLDIQRVFRADGRFGFWVAGVSPCFAEMQ